MISKTFQSRSESHFLKELRELLAVRLTKASGAVGQKSCKNFQPTSKPHISNVLEGDIKSFIIILRLSTFIRPSII